MKKLPNGISNYRELIEGDYYYVDKTKYIEKLENLTDKRIMFLRPRKFGKTLFTSTIECYYDIAREDEFEKLFGNTYIGKNPTPNKNRYHILRFNFSGIDTTDVESTIKGFKKKVIASIDINLAPLEESLFNEAKSENKWTEAALTKIPTIASDVGAFKSEIQDEVTGVLCKNTEKDWVEKLSKLIEDKQYREDIANNAYDEVMKNRITTKSGKGLAEFITSKLKKNVCIVLPSTNISGGITVAIKHGIFLKKKGYDVTIINIDDAKKNVSMVNEENDYLNVIPQKRTEFLAYVDTMVATMWLTLEFVQKYFNCKNKKYLVQGMETEFYDHGVFEKYKANATYCNVLNVEYLTISKWCKRWLEEKFYARKECV